MTELIISQVVNGLVLGFLYVLIAIGLSIIFGMLGIVNFAHGVYFALGAYFALSLRDSLGPWAIVLAPLCVGIVGMIIEMTISAGLRRNRRKSRSMMARMRCMAQFRCMINALSAALGDCRLSRN